MKRVIKNVLPLVLLFSCTAIGFSVASDRGIVVANGEDKPANKSALIIGNSDYESSPLRNPVNDARAMAKTLRLLGFEVVEKENVTMALMIESIQEFGKKIRKGGVGLFYFAGHGVQLNGENYLIPVESGIQHEEHVRYKAVNLGEVLAEMEIAKNALNIVILDACRNNPLKRGFRSTAQGLAYINAPSGTLIAYATAPGSVAKDGDRDNGLYTQELMKNMLTPGLRIEDVFKRTRKSLQEMTSNQQIPWESSSLVGDFFFNPTGVSEILKPTGYQGAQQQTQITGTVPGGEQTSSHYTSPSPTPDVGGTVRISREDQPLRLAIFPWNLNGGARTYWRTLLDCAVTSIVKSKLFTPAFSYYNIDAKYGFKRITSNEFSQSGIEIWSDVGNRKRPNIDGICKLANESHIDVVLLCDWDLQEEGISLLSSLSIYIVDVSSHSVVSADRKEQLGAGDLASKVSIALDNCIEKYKRAIQRR